MIRKKWKNSTLYKSLDTLNPVDNLYSIKSFTI